MLLLTGATVLTSSYLPQAVSIRSQPPTLRASLLLALEAPAPVAPMAAALDKMDAEAVNLNKPGSIKPVRGPDGRLQPVLTLPGDSLETTPLMGYITALSTAVTICVVARAFFLSCGPAAPLLSVAAGMLAGEMFSGCFHWATDNYGSLKTPVVGFACAAFQGHHLAPWTISHRSFPNNVYKIAAATIPLIVLGLTLLSPCGAAFVGITFYLQLLAQEFHRWTHTPPKLLPAWKRWLQNAGIALPMKEHIDHHRPPFDKHYCILTGRINGLLDSEPLLFWRRLEAIVYRCNGQEPLSWKDPRVKEIALRTLLGPRSP